MKKREATLEEWRSLFEAAVKYKEIACWEWMYDTDIYGVQNIITHEIGYCCIMGNAKEVFGLNIYTGDKGLKSYMDTLFQTIPYEDISFIQNCLTLNFEDRDELDRNDLNIIKNLGLKFRGRKQWPYFRNYKPGYYPGYLDRDEVIYFTYVLEQTVEVAKRCAENKSAVIPDDEEKILVRVPYITGGKVEWKDEYIELAYVEEDEIIYEEVDELALRRIKDSSRRKSGIWEIDFFHAPAVVKEEGRPYYPLVFIVADAETGMMLDMSMTSDFKEYMKEFRKSFIQLLAKNKSLPETILVQRQNVINTLEPVAKRLDIKIDSVEELIVVQDFRRSLERLL